MQNFYLKCQKQVYHRASLGVMRCQYATMGNIGQSAVGLHLESAVSILLRIGIEWRLSAAKYIGRIRASWSVSCDNGRQ